MHIISKAPFEESARKYTNDALALQALYRVIKETDFSTPEEMRTAFPNLDNFKYRNKWYVLDVGGNNLEVIAYINFVNKRFFVKHITNHAEYDKLTDLFRRTKK